MAQGADNKGHAAEQGDPGGGRQGRVIKPAPARTFFEGIFQAAEGQGQQQNTEIVGAAQQSGVGAVYFYQQRHCHRDVNPRNHVDKEQPVPVVVFGDPAAHRWTQRRGEGGQAADRRRGNNPLFALEKGESGGEHQGDHRPARQSLQGAEGDHTLDVPRPAAQQAHQREARRGSGKQPAGRHDPGQPAGKRNNNDLGDQVAGLYPDGFIVARRQAAANIPQRG